MKTSKQQPPRNSPYRGNDSKTFWKSAVTGRGLEELEQLYTPKFGITQEAKIAAAGSCFAQHITRNMRLHGFTVLDVEPPPSGLANDQAVRFGFLTYSARYGNVYHVRQLRQLLEESMGIRDPGDIVWTKDDRYYDALRPSVEPDGLRTADLVHVHRRRHVQKVLELMKACDLFVFTFGLTEAWTDSSTGTVFPTAPGTVAGSYDSEAHELVNFTHSQVLADFVRFRELLRRINPGIRFLITVSPVAIAATARDEHVLAANSYSKSTLRSVAGELTQCYGDVDYFPSYDIVTGAPARGRLYDDSGREVTKNGVGFIMNYFFREHVGTPTTRTDPIELRSEDESREDPVVCEDVLLEAFGS